MFLLLIFAILIWLGQLIFSYFFVDKAILGMMVPVYPMAGKLYSLVEFGNTHRNLITPIWIGLISILTGFQIYCLFNSKKTFSYKKLIFGAAIIAILAALSYPVFSRDIFNYLFAGKTVTYYHQNPFLVMPKEFMETDLWLRFTHNTDNIYYRIGSLAITYLYGPVFLIYSLIPFWIFGPVQFQKLFWSYKLIGAGLFLLTGWFIKKINPKDRFVWAYWFFNPFLIFELLLNSHNDLVMIFLFVLSVYFWQKNKILGILAYLLSVLTKFVSGIFVVSFLFKKEKRILVYKMLGFIVLFFNAFDQRQSWYYSWVYMVFPFAKLKRSTWMWLFILQTVLILDYSGFLLLNRWTLNPYFPYQHIFRWIIPVIMLFNEFEILRIIKFIKVYSSSLAGKRGLL